MAMNYNDLIGPKSKAGSIQSFVRYKPVKAEVVLEDAQALIYMHLRVREMRASAVITLAADASTVALPTGYLEPISMQDREGWNVIPERYVSDDQLLRKRTYTDDVLDTGTPMHLAVFDELFQFECKAEEQRKFDLVYFKTPTALSASNTTNFLTRRYPQIVRVGCLAEAARFMKDNEEFTLRETELIALCEKANAESDLGRAA